MQSIVSHMEKYFCHKFWGSGQANQLIPFRIIDVVNLWEYFKLTNTNSWLNYSGVNSFIFNIFSVKTKYLFKNGETPHKYKYSVPSKIVVYSTDPSAIKQWYFIRSLTMKKKNIFQNQSQEILALFEMAENRSRVMCVPMDYAKKDHMVMFCNGNGQILRKPFSIKNSKAGKDYLKRAMPATHVPFSISCFLLQKFRGKALIAATLKNKPTSR